MENQQQPRWMRSPTDEQIKMLAEPPPADALGSRSAYGDDDEGGNAKTLSYVEGWWVIDQLNHIAGVDGWRSEMVGLPQLGEIRRIKKARRNGEVENLVQSVSVTVRIYAFGTIHDGVGVGQAEAPEANFSQVVEKAIKEAETDGLKRAASKFGFRLGLSLYKDASDARRAAKGGRSASKPAADLPDVKTDPMGHYRARLLGCRSQPEYGDLMKDIKSGKFDGVNAKVLWDETHAHYEKLPKSKPPETSYSVKAPFGKNKGKPLADLDDRDLNYFADRSRDDLADPGKAQWHDKTRAQLAAIEAELAYRANNRQAA